MGRVPPRVAGVAVSAPEIVIPDLPADLLMASASAASAIAKVEGRA